jgi:hypothetical protein
MTVRRIGFGCTLPLLFLAAALSGRAVTIQYSGGYGTGSGNFTGVANLSGCSGVLLADGIHVLTAAHCVADVTVNAQFQTILTPITPTLNFFTSSDPSGLADAVTGIQFNPLTSVWFNSDPTAGMTYDLAILDLAAPAPADATRYNLDLTGDATVGSSVVMAGWGLQGYPGGSVAGTGGSRGAGTNTVAGVFTSVQDGALTANLPDTPIALYWTTTSDTNNPSDTTGLSNAGDSGGPLLYNGNVIGITDFGDLPRCDPGCNVAVNQTYEAGYQDLANPGNADWLTSVLDETPEPGTWMLAAGGALLLFLCRRKIVRCESSGN